MRSSVRTDRSSGSRIHLTDGPSPGGSFLTHSTLTTAPNPVQLQAEVLDQRCVAPEHFVLTLDAPEIAATARPGQFAMLRPGDTVDPLLPRAFSVYHADQEAGIIEILYRLVGNGTARLSALHAGEMVSLWGPLGNRFQTPESGWITLVGGGVGVPPLIYLAETLAREESPVEVVALIGAATADYVLGVDQLRAAGAHVQTATDDGSVGQRGLVTTLLDRSLETRPGPVLACGPLPMLAAVAGIAEAAGLPAQLCMEAPMACGVGVCLGCSVPLRRGGYTRVCRDGPVFAAGEIDWDKTLSG